MGSGVTAAIPVTAHSRVGDLRVGTRPRRWGRGRSPRSATPDGAATAEVVLRLAVLLQAGVSPARAWEHIARAGDPSAGLVVGSLERGMPLPEAIAAVGTGSWREVAVACKVAGVVGAPLAECLRGVAFALRDAQEAADDVRIALAEPAGTARLMSWLPLVALALGAALGFDMLGTLVGNPLGLACLGGGAVLIVVAHRWTGGLVRGAQALGGVPGLDAELMAIALSGGVSIDRARKVVRGARALAAPGPESGAATPGASATPPGVPRRAEAAARAAVGSRDADEIDAVLALSQGAGVPATELLRASAAHARHRARVEGRLRAARLSSHLLVPLGVCTLPAFLLLGVAPMLLSVMSTMSISL
jgi:tight adherence protein B